MWEWRVETKVIYMERRDLDGWKEEPIGEK